jgi:hypothetical protein
MKTDDFLSDYEHLLHAAAVRRLRERDQRTRVPLRRFAAFGALAVIALIVAVVLASIAQAPSPPGPPADERPAPTSTPTATPVAGPPRHSVFDAPASAPLSRDQYHDLIEDEIVRRRGPQWDQLRTATSGFDVTAFAAPGQGEDVCVISASRRYGTTFACGEPTETTRALTIRFGLRKHATLVVGLVPDGATSVDIVSAAATVSAPVRNNAFVARIGEESAEVRWRDAAGEHAEPLAPSAASMSRPSPSVTGDGYP